MNGGTYPPTWASTRGALGQDIFYIPVGTILGKFRACFEAKGTKATAYMDDIAIFCLDINSHTVWAIAFPNEELRQVSVTKGDENGSLTTDGLHPDFARKSANG